MSPQVSIIIVNYNSGQFLTASVTAALTSTVAVDLWIVDNDSQDTSLTTLRATFGHDPRLHIIALNTNVGFATANNRALNRAEGEWLLLLNPDCIVQPDTIERMIAVLKYHNDAGMAGCLICNPDGTEQAGCRRMLPTPWNGLAQALYLHRWFSPLKSLEQLDLLGSPLPQQPVFIEAISGAFMLLRRTALQQVGLLDENYFLHCEDLDWCQAFREAGWKILFVPQVKVIHYKGACSHSRPLFVLWHKHRGMLRFYRKFLSRHYSKLFNLLVMLGIALRFILMLPITLFTAQQQFKFSLTATPTPITATIPDLPLFTQLHNCRVLVTGGTGFIGRRLVTELLRQGAKVRILSRSIPTANFWPQQPVEWVRGDLIDSHSVIGICNEIDTVFHLASSAHLIDNHTEQTDPHTQVTAQGTARLLKEAASAHIQRMIFISSVKAMGEGNEQCLDETSPELPMSSYGKAKLYAERLVIATGQSTDIHVTILRLPMVYGPGNKGNLPRMIQAIRAGTFPPLPPVPNRRSMVHVDDTIQAMLLAAIGKQPNGRTYIVTDGEIYSTAAIERMIRIQLGKKLPYWNLPFWLLRLAAWGGDGIHAFGWPVPINSEILYKLMGSACYQHTRIQQELGFQPRFTIQTALLEMIAELDPL